MTLLTYILILMVSLLWIVLWVLGRITARQRDLAVSLGNVQAAQCRVLEDIYKLSYAIAAVKVAQEDFANALQEAREDLRPAAKKEDNRITILKHGKPHHKCHYGDPHYHEAFRTPGLSLLHPDGTHEEGIQ